MDFDRKRYDRIEEDPSPPLKSHRENDSPIVRFLKGFASTPCKREKF
jgi:hypothetical protein